MISWPPVLLCTVRFDEMHLLEGQRDPGHNHNTCSELRSNSWLLQGWQEHSGGNSLWWNGNGSSVGITWILSTHQPTKSLWSIPHSTILCTDVILHKEKCLLWSENVEVCKGQIDWTFGIRIPSVPSTKKSYNPCYNGSSVVCGWNDYHIKTKAISGVPE